jgi:hypothetical protein
MPLPKIDTPVYELTLPLSKKKIKYRPFLVKEQKNLLMAMESGDRESIEQNVQQVLNNCTITKKIEIDKLPVLDIEYYFIHLRARSVGEVVENKYRCENEVDGKTCGNVMETSVNLLELQVTDIPKDDGVIQLTPTISIKMGYPKFSVLNRLNEVQTGTEIAFRLIADSVEYIYDDSSQQFYYANELKQEEIIEFIESLSQQQYEKIEAFFANLPKLQKKIEMKCSRCGFEHKIDIEGLESFFA